MGLFSVTQFVDDLLTVSKLDSTSLLSGNDCRRGSGIRLGESRVGAVAKHTALDHTLLILY